MRAVEILLNGLATLLGAFVGAWAAFRFERRQKADEAMKANVAGVNRALFTLSNIWNVLQQFDDECIEPVRNQPDRWLNMPITISRNYGPTTFDARDLSFLIESKHPDVFGAVVFEEQRLSHVIALIEERSDIISRQVNARFEQAGIAPRVQTFTEADAERILGPGLVHRLKQLDEAIVNSCANTIASSRAAFDALQRAVFAIYKGKKQVVLDVEFKGRRGTVLATRG